MFGDVNVCVMDAHFSCVPSPKSRLTSFIIHVLIALNVTANGALHAILSIDMYNPIWFPAFSQLFPKLFVSLSLWSVLGMNRQLSIFLVRFDISIFPFSSTIPTGFLIPSPSISSSQTSPIPSLSVSVCEGLYVVGQLSFSLSTPSQS